MGWGQYTRRSMPESYSSNHVGLQLGKTATRIMGWGQYTRRSMPESYSSNHVGLQLGKTEACVTVPETVALCRRTTGRRFFCVIFFCSFFCCYLPRHPAPASLLLIATDHLWCELVRTTNPFNSYALLCCDHEAYLLEHRGKRENLLEVDIEDWLSMIILLRVTVKRAVCCSTSSVLLERRPYGLLCASP